MLIATLVSALANIAINFVCIPFWRENAVAFSTIVAEAIMMLGNDFSGMTNNYNNRNESQDFIQELSDYLRRQQEKMHRRCIILLTNSFFEVI